MGRPRGERAVGTVTAGKPVEEMHIKGLVHPKMKILSVFTHPHVVSTP